MKLFVQPSLFPLAEDTPLLLELTVVQVGQSLSLGASVTRLDTLETIALSATPRQTLSRGHEEAHEALAELLRSVHELSGPFAPSVPETSPLRG